MGVESAHQQNETNQPPNEDVFQALGSMGAQTTNNDIHKLAANLDRQHNNNNAENNNGNSSSSPADNIHMSSPDDYMDDDSSSSSSEDHHHLAIDNDDEELGKTCPTFTSKGKFIHYEYRAKGNNNNNLIQEEEVQASEGGATVKQQFVANELQHTNTTNNIHNTSSSQQGSTTTSKRSIWYLVIVTLLVAIIGISSAAIYMTRGGNTNSSSNNNSSKEHTHPKKEHDPRNPTTGVVDDYDEGEENNVLPIDDPWEEDPTIPQQQHTHPKVDHSTPHDHPNNRNPTSPVGVTAPPPPPAPGGDYDAVYNRPFKNGQLGIAAGSTNTVTMFDNSDVVDVSSVAESIIPSTATTTGNNNNMFNDGKIHIEANAVSTIIRSNPDYKWEGLQELGIEGDERISYIRFQYRNNDDNDDDDAPIITKAVLRLYLKTHRDDVDYATVQVSALPYGGIWYDESISWNDPPSSIDEYVVNTFLTKGSPFGVQLIEVDVTSAIAHPMRKKNDDGDDDGGSVTFKLSTESNGDYWFASRKWNGGEAVPELVLTLST